MLHRETPGVPEAGEYGATIAAIATARGQAALAIVRLSGPDAVAIADRCFSGDLTVAASHTAHVGWIDSAEGVRLDQVVATVFRAPGTATGEDVVEVTTHGGDLLPQLVLRRLLDAGARLAEPGEFTQRAFLNGKLDLAQAEAVADLIHAQSSLAGRAAVQHLQGRYSTVLDAIRQRLIQTLALLELELDFSEEDVAFADRSALLALLDEALERMRDLLDGSRLGALVRDGVRVVIAGRPNAGKSTLLNALVEQDRAIVSPTSGTTRDVLEAEVEIEGLRYRFVDTAGLRTTADAVEAEGIRRAEAQVASANALLYLFDATRPLDPEEHVWLARVRETDPDLPVAVLANKVDLVASGSVLHRETADFAISATRALHDPSGLDRIKGWLSLQAGGEAARYDGSVLVMNERHRQHLQRAHDAAARARDLVAQGEGSELLALDLRQVLDELGRITGLVTSDDVLGAIFAQFCIGK